MTKVKTLETILYRLPLPEPVEAAAAGVMGEFELVMVRIKDNNGTEGCGYTALMVNQGAAVAKIIENVCAEGILGEDARNIEWLWSKLSKGCGMDRKLRESGRKNLDQFWSKSDHRTPRNKRKTKVYLKNIAYLPTI